jgi:hypothetical protein
MSEMKKHLDRIRLLESKELLSEAPAVTAPAAKVGGKLASKFIPGVGAAAGAYDAYQRGKAGDATGAAIAGLTGAASTIPGIGTGAALAGMGVQAIRDKWRTGSWMPDQDQIAAASQQNQAQASGQPATVAGQAAQAVKNVGQGIANTVSQTAQSVKTALAPQQLPLIPQLKPGADTNVAKLQQQLVAKGAKIAIDGFMGPKTQAAMKQFPDVQLAGKNNKIKGELMSESDKMAALRARLMQIEESAQLNEFGGLLKTGATAAKNLVRGFKGQAPRSATGQFTTAGGATKVGRGAAAVKNAVANNKGVAGAAAAGGVAAGVAGTLGAQALLSPGADQTQVAVQPVSGSTASGSGGRPQASGSPATPASSISAQEKAELDALAAELEVHMGRLPELDNLLLQHQALLKK